MVHIIKTQASAEQISEMLQVLQTYIKLAVDVRRRVTAGGGALHADWIPTSYEVRFESLINIRPKQGNRKMTIEDTGLRSTVEQVVRERLA